MAKMRVLLVGATGATGGSVVDGLLEAGNFVRATAQRQSLKFG